CGSAGGGRQDDVGTSQLLQSCSRILGLGVDVNVRSQLEREMFFFWTEPDRNGAEAHLFGVLHAEMAQTADTLDSNGIASTSVVAERIECGDAGTDQRGRIFRFELFRYESQCACLCDHHFRIAAITRHSSNNRVPAICRVAAATG